MSFIKRTQISKYICSLRGATLWLLVLGGLFTANFSLADSAAEDLNRRLTYPFGIIQSKQAVSAPDYRLVVSQVKWVNNALRIDKFVMVGVSGSATLQGISEGHSSKQVFEQLNDQLEGAGAQVVFSCVARDCGESNIWANKIFNESRLYGKDREQFYSVYALKLGGAPHAVVLYTIQRGNGRVYAYTELLALAAVPTQLDAFFQKEAEDSELQISVDITHRLELDFLTDSLHRQVEDRLARFPDHQLWILCKLEDKDKGSKALLGESKELVMATRHWLEVKGVDVERINVLPLGPFPTAYAVGKSQLIFEFSAP